MFLVPFFVDPLDGPPSSVLPVAQGVALQRRVALGGRVRNRLIAVCSWLSGCMPRRKDRYLIELGVVRQEP